MRIPHPITVDFETFSIAYHPYHPPVPTSVSIKPWGRKPAKYSWGHTHGNNCSLGTACGALQEALNNSEGVLFHHAKFDMSVCKERLGLTLPPWHLIHDTMFLLFLDDPNQKTIGLKPAANRLFGLETTERDLVAEWLVKWGNEQGIKPKISPSTKSDNSFMNWLPFAPGNLVVDYAEGDVNRTELIFRHAYEDIIKRGMKEAYDRERKFVFVLMDMEKRGVPVDLDRLEHDYEIGCKAIDRVNEYIYKRLKVDDVDFNINNGDKLMRAICAMGLADEDDIPKTPTGLMSSSIKSGALNFIKDPKLRGMLIYKAQMDNITGNFQKTWVEIAHGTGGYIHCDWKQVVGSGGGARTGRMQSSPNFQNIPNDPPLCFDRDVADKLAIATDPVEIAKLKKLKLPKPPIELPRLFKMRDYIIPWAKDYVLADRDYSQQEPRILAHFEDGALKDQYIANPWIDYHDNAQAQLLAILGLQYERKAVKVVNLGLIYGQGVPSLAAKLEAPIEEVKSIKDGILAMYPGLSALNRQYKALAKNGEPIYTWGDRQYYCEEPIIFGGKYMSFEYKMVNTQIQGSAADCTKEAMIRYYELKPEHHFLFIQVHDQLLNSVPRKELKQGMGYLREAMESVEFKVPMLSEGKWSPHTWAQLEHYDKKGKVVYHGA